MSTIKRVFPSLQLHKDNSPLAFSSGIHLPVSFLTDLTDQQTVEINDLLNAGCLLVVLSLAESD